MRIYSEYLYPRIVNNILSNPQITMYRKDILANVSGNILEIGFGTGLNLPCYPSFVKNITAIDSNEGMNILAQRRAEQSGIKVNLKELNAEVMPFDNNFFDTVVSTFTFCSINDINNALKEIHRILKNNGKLIFLEHGLSPNPKIRKWQNLINPFYLKISEGCNLNRDIKKIIENNNFKITQIEQFYCEDMLKISGYLYKGIAGPFHNPPKIDIRL